MNNKINKTDNPNQNPKKRVLFIITQSEFGGAQRFLYELVARLDKEKYEILVASGAKEKDLFLKSLQEKNIETEVLKFLKREVNPFFDCLGIMELIKLINRFRPEYLFLNSSKAGILGSIAGFKIKFFRPNRFKSLKIIYRIGGWSFNDPWPLWKKKIFILAEKITAKFKDVIIVNSKSDYDQAIRLKIRPKKELKLIYNGIDALKFDFLPPEIARKKLKLSPLKKIIGTIANFYPTKGIEYLIEAFNILKPKSQNPDLKLVIIGDGEEKEKLKELIKKYKLKNEIILLGQIEEASKYIKAFDIFILPSVKEGFPWVILEAMAAKVPVIGTKVGGVPEIIESGKNGILVESKNPQELAKAIKYLSENERILQEIGIQGHQTVLFKFQVEKMIREIEELFD